MNKTTIEWQIQHNAYTGETRDETIARLRLGKSKMAKYLRRLLKRYPTGQFTP